MQSDLGKLFIGGISWDTNEERLKEYFSSYGQVLEAVIMKDHTTGRARGFGFIVFLDPSVAERVTKEKHNIDGRMVEAKKAVPRDDQNTISRNSNTNIEGSPGRTRKIFVGGLASTVTENDFKMYFEQYGTITDVVVMYDHSTQRPRGFGFITYDSEDAVDQVLLKTFHELNGKMVEVKRAVPKHLSPGPYPFGSGFGFPRNNTFPYSPNPIGIGGYGRFNPIPSGRNGIGPFGSGYNFEPGMSGGTNFNNISAYERGMTGLGLGPDPGPYYNSNGFRNPISYDGGNGGNTSFFSSNPRNLWDNDGLNYGSNSPGVIGGGVLGNNGFNWGSGNGSGSGASFGYGNGVDPTWGSVNSYGRNASNSVGATSSYGGSGGSYDGPFSDFYGSGGSVYGADPTWRSVNSERDESGPFSEYGLGNGSDVQAKSSSGLVGGYGVDRGITG